VHRGGRGAGERGGTAGGRHRGHGSLSETIRIKEGIYKVIEAHGGWPRPFVTEANNG
jgi:hypothetical protein